MKKLLALAVLLISVFSTSCTTVAETPEPANLERVILQLRWDHQFQFGGYYAADWQGFYRAEGLEVEIRSALQPDGKILSATEEVAAGRADFGIGGADVLIAHDNGADLRVASTIFQRSAARFYLNQDTPYSSPADMLNLRVARNVNDLIDVEFQAMLLSEGVDPKLVTPYRHQPDIDRLLSDEVQVIPGYKTTIPYIASEAGARLKEIDPATYGVDFYGDSIFTTGELATRDPDLVERFVQASLKGWEYALTHPDAIAQEISTQFEQIAPTNDSLAFNRFQAGVVHELTLYPLVELGQINPYRWEKMHQLLADLGLVQQELVLDSFIFDRERIQAKYEQGLLEISMQALIVAIIAVVAIFAWNYMLRKSVRERTRELQQELTARRQAEAALRKSAATLQRSQEVAHLGDWTWDTPTNTVTWSDEMYRIFGLDPKNFSGDLNTIIAQAIHPDDQEKVNQSNEWVLKEARPGAIEYRVLSPDGTVRWVWAQPGDISFDDAGQVTRLSGIVQDITERKQRENELQLHSEILHNLAEGVHLTRVSDGSLVYANTAMEQMFAYQPGELPGRHVSVLNAPTDQDPEETAHQIIASLNETGRWQGEILNIKKDGTTFWCEASVVTFHHPRYGLTWISVHQDITHRKQAENALRESEENLRITLNSIGDAVISTDTAGRVVRMNPVAEALTGWTETAAAGQPLADVFNVVDEKTRQPIQNPVKTILAANGIVELSNHIILLSRTGVEHQIANSGTQIRDAHGQTIGVVLVFRDVTEELRTQQELLKIKKLESVGILAGGIAHDFNNLLMSLMGNLELAQMSLSPEHKAYHYLQAARKSMDTATNLAYQLLTFAKGGEPIKETVALGEVITEMAQFSMRGSNLKLETRIAPDLWLVEADIGQLNQVISNLVINAQQAMPNGGTISLSAENFGTIEDRQVKICVEDNGIGIAPHQIDQIFDPYFTTKASGSGLGLAVSHSIIKKHNGRITVHSQVDQGTIFTIYLPAATDDAAYSARGPLPDRASAASFSARILVLDDEASVREIIGAMLEQLGHHATFAAEGQEAVDLYQAAYAIGDHFQAVILDLTIPGGIGGFQVSREILALDPAARLIVTSGYATDPIIANYVQFGFAARIVKPFRMADLEQVIGDTLTQPKSNHPGGNEFAVWSDMME